MTTPENTPTRPDLTGPNVTGPDLAERTSFADELLDELLPEELDWRHLVTSYPVTCLTAAAVGGYLLGRSRGSTMVAAMAAFATETVSKNVNSLLGEDVL